MRYIRSALMHFCRGHLTAKHLVYAIRKRPVAVSSKGTSWIIDPDFIA